MCRMCRYRNIQQPASREHILSLLALLEQPKALPPEQALRLGGQLLAALGGSGPLRCDPVPSAATDETRGWSPAS
jgi:hypothetical protein